MTETKSICCYCGVGCGVIVESDDGRVTGVWKAARPVARHEPHRHGGETVRSCRGAIPRHGPGRHAAARTGEWRFCQGNSRRGEIVIKVRASSELQTAQTFLPMHWGGNFLSGFGCNALTVAAIDPVSGQPELKHAAVQVEKADLPWQMVVLRKNNELSHLLKVQPLLARFPYASVGLVGQDEPVMVLRVAAESPVDGAWLAELDRLLEIDDDLSAMAYHDTRRGISKRILVCDGEVVAARLSGEIAAYEWLKDGMAKGLPVEAVRAWLLAPLAAPPFGAVQRGRIVCNCLNVAENEIQGALAATPDFAGLQEKLKCGTQCGSCVPGIKRMFNQHRIAGATS